MRRYTRCKRHTYRPPPSRDRPRQNGGTTVEQETETDTCQLRECQPLDIPCHLENLSRQISCGLSSAGEGIVGGVKEIGNVVILILILVLIISILR